MSGEKPGSDRNRRDVLKNSAVMAAGTGGLAMAASGGASAGHCWYEYDCYTTDSRCGHREAEIYRKCCSYWWGTSCGDWYYTGYCC